MSDYLVTEINNAPNIAIRLRTEIIDGGGDGHLATLTVRDRATNTVHTLPACAVFLLIGAEPGTDWLAGAVERDEHGYLLTGRDLISDNESAAAWPLARPPLLLETSRPGVPQRRRASRLHQTRRVSVEKVRSPFDSSTSTSPKHAAESSGRLCGYSPSPADRLREPPATFRTPVAAPHSATDPGGHVGGAACAIMTAAPTTPSAAV
jgi:hypothetical protein